LAAQLIGHSLAQAKHKHNSPMHVLILTETRIYIAKNQFRAEASTNARRSVTEAVGRSHAPALVQVMSTGTIMLLPDFFIRAIASSTFVWQN
jgi:hypothetical protein